MRANSKTSVRKLGSGPVGCPWRRPTLHIQERLMVIVKPTRTPKITQVRPVGMPDEGFCKTNFGLAMQIANILLHIKKSNITSWSFIRDFYVHVDQQFDDDLHTFSSLHSLDFSTAASHPLSAYLKPHSRQPLERSVNPQDTQAEHYMG